jgi:hypothetical protein
MAKGEKIQIFSTSFSEEKPGTPSAKQKRLFYSRAGALATSRPWPRVIEVFCFFFSKKKFLAKSNP